ncbi:hypothetical protein KKG24_03390 [Patescibacteria group bacterium]|nr:hypothetical protein [Patescibacteria group bacterium]
MKNNFQKILLFIFIILLVLFCLAFVFLYQKIGDNNQKGQQGAINLQIEEHRYDEIVSLNQMLQKIVPERALLEEHFIKSSDVVPFLNTVEKLAKEAGVSSQINSVDVKDNMSLKVELRALGGFKAIYKFLILLEDSPYLLDFSSMNLHKLLSSSGSGKNESNLSWEVVFQIKLLSFIP